MLIFFVLKIKHMLPDTLERLKFYFDIDFDRNNDKCFLKEIKKYGKFRFTKLHKIEILNFHKKNAKELRFLD